MFGSVTADAQVVRRFPQIAVSPENFVAANSEGCAMVSNFGLYAILTNPVVSAMAGWRAFR